MINQYLTFMLHNTLYAVPVSHVQEVLEYTAPEQLPCTVECIEGLISSRGQGIQVINLCRKFGLDVSPVTKNTRIIVLELNTPQENDENHVTIFGAVADSVEEVMDVKTEELDAVPKFGNTISAEYISGVGKKGDAFVILLDVERIFQFHLTAKEKE